jgi:hypothetical protein
LEVGYVKDRERVVQRTFRFTFGREKMDTLAKKELGPGAGLFATVALAGKLYRASFPKPMWTETEEPKSKAVAVTATREYAGEGGVRQYGPEGGWVTAAGL